jgi:signal transduction histidine kinase
LYGDGVALALDGARIRGALLAIGVAAPIALSIAVGYRALSSEEAALEREAVARLDAYAATLEQRIREDSENAAVKLEGLRVPPDPSQLGDLGASLDALTPVFAIGFVMNESGERLHPTRPTRGEASAEKPGCRDALDREADAARRDNTDRAFLLSHCEETRSVLGRYVWPRLALEAIRDRRDDALVERLTDWIDRHNATLRSGERELIRTQLASTGTLAPDEVRRFDEVLSRRDATDAMDRALATSAARRALFGAVGRERWVGEGQIGEVRRSPPLSVGFVTTRESLTQSMAVLARDALLPAEFSVRVRASEAIPGEAFVATRVLAPSLVLEVRLANRASLAAEVRRSRTNLMIATASASVLVLAIAVVLFLRARKAQLSSELRTTYVAALAHELRTPVASMRMLAELLDKEESGDPDARELTSALAKESVRLSRTVEKLSALSTLFRPDARAKITSTSPLEAIESAVSTFQATHPDARLETKFDEGVRCGVDADLVELAIENLLENAAKYAPDGMPYEVSLRRESGGARIVVADGGGGVAPEDRTRIFEMFTRADDRLSKATEGLGLGLALVQSVAKAHGGRAWVESNGSRGAAFHVLIRDRERA